MPDFDVQLVIQHVDFDVFFSMQPWPFYISFLFGTISVVQKKCSGLPIEEIPLAMPCSQLRDSLGSMKDISVLKGVQ